MSPLVTIIVSLSLASVIGLAIGNVKIKNVSLGIGGVLFSGLAVGYILHKLGIELSSDVMHFVKEFGLILFVYTIGNQVGPTFFSVLKKSGLKLNIFASLIVFGGVLVAVLIYKLAGIELPVILGLFSGGVTNTPSLGAAQQVLKEVGATASDVIKPSVGYAVAYPFGIAGILLAMQLIKFIFKIDISKQEESFNNDNRSAGPAMVGKSVKITNGDVDGKSLKEVLSFFDAKCVVTRMTSEEGVFVPKGSDKVCLNSCVHLVGQKENVEKFAAKLGEEVSDSVLKKKTDLEVEKFAVTNTKILGRSVLGLGIGDATAIVVSRITRSGIDLLPKVSVKLQFGDIITVIGRKNDVKSAARIFGNNEGALKQAQVIPIFLAIGLGVLLGCVPISIPGATVPVKLGLAGGPLIVAILFARLGNLGSLVWFMPPSANHIMREIGIVLFLAVVGLQSGDRFVDAIIYGDGLLWMGYAAMITFFPIFVVGIIAVYLKTNYLSVCGLLAGSMTDPPALAFANSMSEKTQASAQGYASVYPLAMFLRILAPQILIILLW
jgi:putative transport protein